MLCSKQQALHDLSYNACASNIIVDRLEFEEEVEEEGTRAARAPAARAARQAAAGNRRKKPRLDVEGNRPATQQSSMEIRALLQNRAPLLRPRGLPLALAHAEVRCCHGLTTAFDGKLVNLGCRPPPPKIACAYILCKPSGGVSHNNVCIFGRRTLPWRTCFCGLRSCLGWRLSSSLYMRAQWIRRMRRKRHRAHRAGPPGQGSPWLRR